MSTELNNLEVKDDPEAKVNGRAPKKRPASSKRLSVFARTFVAVIIAHAIVLALLGLFVQQPAVLIMAGIEALIASLTLFGVRWVPILGSIIGALMLFVFTSATGFPIHHLSHPKDAFGYDALPALSYLMFVVMTGLFWSATMLIITGVATVVHNYFLRSVKSFPWFRAALTGALCLWGGAVILGALIQPDPPVAPVGSSALPVVHLQVGNFSQPSITLNKGEKLTLIDDGSYHHNISTGQWLHGQPVLQDQPGGPTVRNKDLDAANATLVIGPFNTAGTFYIICSLHHNMTLQVIVQ